MTLSGLFLYPVKGCRGLPVAEAQVDALGLAGDRRFMIVDLAGKFLTQRSHPRMALINTALTGSTLTLTAAGQDELVVARGSDSAAPLRMVEVWGSTGLQAEDCGERAAAWVSDAIGSPARLVRAGTAFQRFVKPAKARPGDVVSFADAFPFLIVSEASLADLNGRLSARGENPVPMNRFRPNLVINDCPAFAEDTWPRLRIGAVTFRAGGHCARCVVTTTDQESAERGKEPLRTLASYRRDPASPGDVIFGQNLIHETKTGTLRVGDAVMPV
ncbi:MAG TPA: MOSC N-terminal beta barrel domain-containing protein [Opitutaceae bacterium]